MKTAPAAGASEGSGKLEVVVMAAGLNRGFFRLINGTTLAVCRTAAVTSCKPGLFLPLNSRTNRVNVSPTGKPEDKAGQSLSARSWRRRNYSNQGGLTNFDGARPAVSGEHGLSPFLARLRLIPSGGVGLQLRTAEMPQSIQGKDADRAQVEQHGGQSHRRERCFRCLT